jgi:hypothetical protein
MSMSSEACHISLLKLLSFVKKLRAGTVLPTASLALTAEYCNIGLPLLQHVFNPYPANVENVLSS